MIFTSTFEVFPHFRPENSQNRDTKTAANNEGRLYFCSQVSVQCKRRGNALATILLNLDRGAVIRLNKLCDIMYGRTLK